MHEAILTKLTIVANKQSKDIQLLEQMSLYSLSTRAHANQTTI